MEYALTDFELFQQINNYKPLNQVHLEIWQSDRTKVDLVCIMYKEGKDKPVTMSNNLALTTSSINLESEGIEILKSEGIRLKKSLKRQFKDLKITSNLRF